MDTTNNKFLSGLYWLLERFKEPSTWAGGSVVAVAIHQIFPGALGTSIISVCAALGGLLAVLLPEKNPTLKLPPGTNAVVLPKNTTTHIVDSSTQTETTIHKG